MPKLCNIDIDRGEEILKSLRRFVTHLKARYPIQRVLLYGSFVKGEIHEGSDIDLLVVDAIPGRIFERIARVIEMTDLPVEPLVYTEEQFERLVEGGNPFLREVLKTAKPLPGSRSPDAAWFLHGDGNVLAEGIGTDVIARRRLK